MDYCTWFPEGWWAHCCQAHDLAYAAQVRRALADGELFLCVAQSAPEHWMAIASSVIAGLMYVGVRLFGGRFYRRSPSQ